MGTLVPCVPIQIRELEPVLCHAGLTSQLIWTSSSNAHPSAFSVDDIQHRRGAQPYSSSKYACDLLSLALNTHYNKQVGHTRSRARPFVASRIYEIGSVSSLGSRGCTHLSLALVSWWPVWPMASSPSSHPSSGPCWCRSFGSWVQR